jgi:hypothetical protein
MEKKRNVAPPNVIVVPSSTTFVSNASARSS